MTKLLLAAVAALALAAASAAATGPTETILLRSTAGSQVAGTATVGAAGAGTSASIKLRGLTPHAAFRALLQAGTCKRYGASSTLAGSGTADAKGSARSAQQVTFHGTKLGFATVADGGHVITVVSGGRAVACGVIPGMS